ncbi:MAG: DMT family transporter [Pseudomonadota bacterium]|nr:DMT family transporter [Pseudomonadota bacterium]
MLADHQEPSSTSVRQDPRPWAGPLIVLIAATSFASGTALAAVSFQYGATPLTVLIYRTTLAFLVLALYLSFSRQVEKLPLQFRLVCLGLGFIVATYSFGLVSAIDRIPLALAVLIFYLYPLLVGVGAWITGQEPMSWSRIAQLLVAFAGLALALDVGGDLLNFDGLALAGLAALAFALLLLINGRILRGRDSRPVTLHMLGMAAIILWTTAIAIGEFPLPNSEVGLAAFFGSGVFFSFSIITLFRAVGMIGSMHVALFMNFEPICSVAFGIFLLGQPMTALQLTGAVVVILSIIWAAVLR